MLNVTSTNNKNIKLLDLLTLRDKFVDAAAQEERCWQTHVFEIPNGEAQRSSHEEPNIIRTEYSWPQSWKPFLFRQFVFYLAPIFFRLVFFVFCFFGYSSRISFNYNVRTHNLNIRI